MALTEANLRRMAGARQSLDSASVYSQRGYDALAGAFDRFGNVLKPWQQYFMNKKEREATQQWESGEAGKGREHALAMLQAQETAKSQAYGPGGYIRGYEEYKSTLPSAQQQLEEWYLTPEGKKRWAQLMEEARIGLPLGKAPEQFDPMTFLIAKYQDMQNAMDRRIIDEQGRERFEDFTDDDWREWKATVERSIDGLPDEGQKQLARNSISLFIDMIKKGEIVVPEAGAGDATGKSSYIAPEPMGSFADAYRKYSDLIKGAKAYSPGVQEVLDDIKRVDDEKRRTKSGYSDSEVKIFVDKVNDVLSKLSKER